MIYKNSLQALRQEMLSRATKQDVAPIKGIESFIPARDEPKQVEETPEDIMARSATWLSEIKKASSEFKRQYNEVASRKASASPAEAFVTGYLDTRSMKRASKEEDKTQATPQEAREAFISRRGESSPSTYAVKRPSEINSFKDAIDLTEGGGEYDTLFAYSNRAGKHFDGFNVSNMTIGEIKAFSDPSGEYGQWVKEQLRKSGKKARVATPMGRYQFVGSTLKSLASEMGLDDNTVFSPEVQDDMFEYYLRKRIARGKTMDEKVTQVREAWEGFKSIPTATLQSLITQYEAT
jgi:hypothetical protein